MANLSFPLYSLNVNLTTPDTSVIGDLPVGTLEGNGLLTIVFNYAFAPAAPANINSVPSGWTEVGTSDTIALIGVNARISFYQKIAGSSEPSNPTWGLDAANIWQCQIWSCENALSTGWVQGKSVLNSATDTNPTALSLTTDKYGQALLFFFGASGTWTGTPPSGMTEVDETGGNYSAFQQIPTPGATGNKVATISGSELWVAFNVALYSEDSVGWGPLLGLKRNRLVH